VAHRKAGQLDRAIPLLEQALEAIRAKLGEDHLNTVIIRRNLAQTYEKALRYQDAEPLYRTAIEAAGRKKPRNDRFYSDLLAAFGHCLIAEQKHAEAATRLRECLEIKEKTQPDDWSTANARSLLGEALAGQRAFAEAEPLLLNAQKVLFDRRDKIPPLDRDTALRDSVARLVRLYEDWGKPTQAQTWKKQLPPPPPTAQPDKGRPRP
jgi:tetratricopeptide (TPR) repeat protein